MVFFVFSIIFSAYQPTKSVSDDIYLVDQFIDYHIKLLTDKPLICYIEDPLASTEKAAWKKFIVNYALFRPKLKKHPL